VDAEHGEHAIGYVQAVDVLGLANAGDGERIAVVHADILQVGALLPISEVEEGSHIELVEADTGGAVPDADELFRVGIAERLEQDAINDSEHDGVGANADRKRNQDDGSEERGAQKAAEYLLELIFKEGHLIVILGVGAGPVTMHSP
jgi:hypothetical protein